MRIPWLYRTAPLPPTESTQPILDQLEHHLEEVRRLARVMNAKAKQLAEEDRRRRGSAQA